jgi:N-methylhydantoinase B/oxoprolinase/acetone carboxylase alpha subunit
MRADGTQWQSMVEAFGKRSTSKWSNVVIRPGDRVQLLTPGGGGWGEPQSRTDARVAEDLAEGWVSAEGRAAYRR